MHNTVTIAVEADSAAEAAKAAYAVLDDYQDEFGWFEEDPTTVIRYGDDPTRFEAELARCREDEEGWLNWAVMEIRPEMDRLQLLLDEKLTDLRERAQLGWPLYHLGTLLRRDRGLDFDTAYWDGIQDSRDQDALQTRCKASPGRQWLVAIDVHS